MNPSMRGLVGFNTDTEEVSCTDYMRTNINWSYFVPEDGELTCKDGTKSVKKGDIIIQFYTSKATEIDYIIIRSKEWKKRIADIAKFEEEERKKYELERANDTSGCEKCCADC